jgi:hypothetical protein
VFSTCLCSQLSKEPVEVCGHHVEAFIIDSARGVNRDADSPKSLSAFCNAALTVVRIVPVVLSLTGSGTLFETRLFLGWFGPRGLATILFALIVVEELDSDAGQTIFTVATWTVLVSVFAHGLTARPWAGRLARRLNAETEPMPEMEPVPELATRSGPMPVTSSDPNQPQEPGTT